MTVQRKPRVCFTVVQDVVALRAVVDDEHGVFAGGSVAPKLSQWNDVARRISVGGVEISAETLRRHVADLAKKHKSHGNEQGTQRMRWGLPWPKSDEEQERDRLVQVYLLKANQLKEATEAPVRRPSLQDSPPPTTKEAVRRCHSPQVSMQKPAQVEEPTGGKAGRSRANVQTEVVRRVSSTLSVPTTPIRSCECDEKIDIKRRRLEMEERMHSRMLDIQSEQIALQREQLRLQSEAMRSLAGSTQAIARALEALRRIS